MRTLILLTLLLFTFTTFADSYESYKAESMAEILVQEFDESKKAIESGSFIPDYNRSSVHQCFIYGRTDTKYNWGQLGFFNTRLVMHRGGLNLSCSSPGKVCIKRNRSNKCVRFEEGIVNHCTQKNDHRFSGFNAVSNLFFMFNNKSNSFIASQDRAYMGKVPIMIGKTKRWDAVNASFDMFSDLIGEAIVSNIDSSILIKIEGKNHVLRQIKYVKHKYEYHKNIDKKFNRLEDQKIKSVIKCTQTDIEIDGSNPSVK